MRIFATSDSLDHWSRHFAHFPVILLDGKPLTQVIMADDVKGIAEIVCMEGKTPLVDEASGIICTTFLQGKVEIIAPRLGDAVN